MEFLFIDGEEICIYKDGEISEYKSGFIEKYKDATLRSIKTSEWRKKSRTEMLLNEYYPFDDEDEFKVKINSAWLVNDKTEILYSFTVNETSGIYKKYLNEENETEAHVISSSELEFSSIYYYDYGIVASVNKNQITSDIAVFSQDLSDYKFVTSGDSLDENPYLHTDGKIYFNSYGVARDEVGNCLGYDNSEIYSLDIKTMEIKEIVNNRKYSLVKPVPYRNGLLMIKKPTETEEKSNIFLDILMIPIRILQGIVGFISAFVTFFSGKPLVSDGGSSNGYTRSKNLKTDEKRLFVLNNFLNVEKELKKNKRDRFPSFIPKSWKLILLKNLETEDNIIQQTYLSGIADYCVLDENNIIATNGKYVFLIKDEEKNYKVKALFKTSCCLKVFPVPEKGKSFNEELFKFL